MGNTAWMAFDLPKHLSMALVAGQQKVPASGKNPRVFTAVLLPVWEQGTGLFKRSRERIGCALVDCTAPTGDASASAKHHMCCSSLISVRLSQSCLCMSALLHTSNGCVHIHFWRV